MTTLGSLSNLPVSETRSFEPTELNPFLGEDVLFGVQVLEVRHDALRSRVSVVLELRVAEYDWQACAGLLVAAGVTRLSWSQDARDEAPTAWTVLTSTSSHSNGGVALHLSGSPTFSLDVLAKRATFFTARIEHLEPLPPPDYTAEGPDEIYRGIPTWESIADNVKAVDHP